MRETATLRVRCSKSKESLKMREKKLKLFPSIKMLALLNASFSFYWSAQLVRLLKSSMTSFLFIISISYWSVWTSLIGSLVSSTRSLVSDLSSGMMDSWQTWSNSQAWLHKREKAFLPILKYYSGCTSILKKALMLSQTARNSLICAPRFSRTTVFNKVSSFLLWIARDKKKVLPLAPSEVPLLSNSMKINSLRLRKSKKISPLRSNHQTILLKPTKMKIQVNRFYQASTKMNWRDSCRIWLPLCQALFLQTS